MLELSILYLLKKQKLSLYAIKKNLDEKLPYLYSASMGSIYPLINKMEKDGLINQKVSYTKGGLKKKTVSITKKGEEVFFNRMMEDFDCPMNHLELFVSAKITFSGLIEEEYRKTMFTKIINKLEEKKQILSLLLKKQKLNEFQGGHIEFLIRHTDSYVKWLEEKL